MLFKYRNQVVTQENIHLELPLYSQYTADVDYNPWTTYSRLDVVNDPALPFVHMQQTSIQIRPGRHQLIESIEIAIRQVHGDEVWDLNRLRGTGEYASSQQNFENACIKLRLFLKRAGVL